MKRSKIDPERLYWIDAIRSFACVCVVAVHAPIPGGRGEAFISPYNYFFLQQEHQFYFL